MSDCDWLIRLLNNGSQWITPLAIILSAVIGAVVAFKVVKHQREIARMRATLDVIMQSESNAFYQNIYATFLTISKREGGLVSVLAASSEEDKKLERELNDFINHYELIAIAIKSKILDEHFYKNWMRTTYIRHFEATSDYINAVRVHHKNDKAYIQFENLVARWKNPKCKC